MKVKPGIIFGQSGSTFTVIMLMNPESNFMCREKRHSRCHLKIIDVTRAASTILDVLLERRIDRYWNVDEDREMSYAWTGYLRGSPCLTKDLLTDIHGPERD